jgi:phage terminase large subunit GpA-like protein
MDALSDPSVHTVAVMKSAQVGYTEALLNTIGYHIAQDAAPILLVQPTLDMAEAFSKDRLAPMLRDTPALKGKVQDARSRDSGNTLLHKQFPGGHITMAGANSPASLASRPVRIVLFDEVDRYPPSAGTEGDPVTLGSKRQATFWNRKRLLGGTPTLKGLSRIERAYQASDQRRFCLPCPECGVSHALEWKNVLWDKSDSGEPLDGRVYMACPNCGAVIEEFQKPAMLAAGEWISGAEFNGTAGFHISELYSPWRSWREIRDDFLAAKDDKETLKAWVNTSLGETWEDSGEKVDEHDLAKRREIYPEVVPAGALVLTAGVDVQADRIEVEVVGWAQNRESWTVAYKIELGDTQQDDVWEKLDALLLTQWPSESGHVLRISAVGVDSGFSAQRVYKFCAPRFARGVLAVKGMQGPGRPVAKRGDPGKIAGPKPPHIYILGVDDIKGTIYSFFNAESGEAGFCHWPDDLPDEYFSQLTAEKRVTKYVRGFPRLEWIKTRKRNEALDCRVYAFAALTILNPTWHAIGALAPKKRPLRVMRSTYLGR